MSKHNYIRDEIRDVLKSKRLQLASIMSKGFHTSLRNAFAHSEYIFDDVNKLIHLETYKGSKWDIKNISYDDWSRRFAYSALLSYHFYAEKLKRRLSLAQDFKKDKFLIALPKTFNNGFRITTIHYETQWDRFSFVSQ